MTSRESFTKVENWLNELDTYSTNHDIVKMLVGNKVGLMPFGDSPNFSVLHSNDSIAGICDQLTAHCP